MAKPAEMPDIVAAAMRRRGRQRYTPHPNLSNNYLAEPRASHGRHSRKSLQPRPAPKRRRKPGAPPGNRNALKSGLYGAEAKALRLRVRLTLARLKLATAQAKLLVVQMGLT